MDGWGRTLRTYVSIASLSCLFPGGGSDGCGKISKVPFFANWRSTLSLICSLYPALKIPTVKKLKETENKLYFLPCSSGGHQHHRKQGDEGILVVYGFALVFALAPISPMFCHQCLPLPLPLPWHEMATERARARANIDGKAWRKWGQGQKRHH